MIVMKFGGSSVESGNAIRQLTDIVRTQLSRRPVVVVSAMGKTTDRLLELASEAARGHAYFVAKHISELQDYHFDEAAHVVEGEALDWLERSLKRQFRDLHTMFIEISDEGRDLTPALQDEIASFGERISSEVIVAALHTAGIPSVHLDARQMILTDERHTQATPLYWQTYARLRRVVPRLGTDRVVVMGGFIGSNEEGAATTLGRGGSDLTASIVGAGISAEEIQIWTDVDGMLTCDPRIMPDGYRLRSITYEEAIAMARAGARVLHPDSVMPAIRRLIPIVIRNSRRPEIEGTRIGSRRQLSAPLPANQVKSISCKQHQTVLEIRPRSFHQAGQWSHALVQLCERHGIAAEVIGENGETTFLTIPGVERYEHLPTELNGCVEVHLRADCAVLTLVGDGIARVPGIGARALSALKQIPTTVVADVQSKLSIRLIVPQSELQRSAALLHREFFRQVDSAFFAKCGEPAPAASSLSPREFPEQPMENRREARTRPLVLAGQH